MNAERGMSAAKGAVLTVAMRWTDRAIGFVSTLILARLLTPADFGLVAMAMVIVGLVEVFLDLGVSSALVQNRDATRQDFDSAWTLRIIQAAVACVAVLLAAPLAADYYNDDRVTGLMRLIALTVLVGGFENIGIVMFQKQMQFDREFVFFAARRLFGVVVTITLALTLRTYWALVVGGLASRAFGVGLSYWMSQYRPSLSMARSGPIWHFSKWNIVNSVTSYLSQQLDRLIIGRRTDAATLGAYSVGREIAAMPSSELLAPLGRVMFPAFVTARNNAAELQRIVLLSLSVQSLIALPAGVGLSLVAREAVPLLLGPQWHSAVPFVQWLALAGIARTLAHSSHYLLLAAGRVRALALYNSTMLAIAAALYFLIFRSADALEIAQIQLGLAFIALVVLQRMGAAYLVSFGIVGFIGQVWRPLAATLIMAGVVAITEGALRESVTWLVLVAKVLTGATSYFAACAILWIAAGRPAGGETYLVSRLLAAIKARPTKSQQQL